MRAWCFVTDIKLSYQITSSWDHWLSSENSVSAHYKLSMADVGSSLVRKQASQKNDRDESEVQTYYISVNDSNYHY